MIRSALLCFVWLALSGASRAADIHKCATPTGIAYQGHPCGGVELPTSGAIASVAQAPRPALVSPADGGGARAAPLCGAQPREPRRLPWRQATICIGMTDDEVLNLPGWGRPATIERTRARREWREEWTYDAGLAGSRRLYFVNGKLTLVETPLVDNPAGPFAKLASPTDSARSATN